MAGQSSMKIVELDPRILKLPSVRVTSYFDSETLELFKHSVREVGVQQPLLVAYDGRDYWVIDGKNRLEEALLNGVEKVPCAVVKCGMKDVLLKNLTLNVLRGKVKPTEQLQVIAELNKTYGMSIDEISKASGLRRDHVEKLLSIARCSDKVITALDEGLISVSHAYEISRVDDRDVQERLLAQTITYRVSSKDLRDIVTETLKILRERREKPAEEAAPARVTIPTVRCEFCGQDWPVKRVAGVNVCMSCYSIAVEAVQHAIEQLKKSAAEARLKEEERLKSITGGE